MSGRHTRLFKSLIILSLLVAGKPVVGQIWFPEYDDYDIHFYSFDLEVNNLYPDLAGSVTIAAEIVKPDVDTLLVELTDHARLDSVLLDEVATPFIHSDDLILIPLEESFPTGTNIELSFYYQIEEGDIIASRGISTVQESNGKSITYTLSEPFYSKSWFPCKQDLSDKIDSACLKFTCPDSCMVGSNGLLVKVEDPGSGKKSFEWRTRYPMAYYLISYAVADYRDYSFYAPLGNNDSTLVQNFIYDSDEYLALNRENIDATADLLLLFSELFGTYPFKDEKYGHCVAPIGGGMEHQTMTTLSDFRFFLVAHELGHQWFGDYTTCSNWQDIWINEGFASYTEPLANEFLKSKESTRDWLLDALLLVLSEPDGSVFVPESSAGDDRRIFDRRLSYKKGAYLLHMIRHEIGDDDTFFRVLQTYSAAFANSVASARDFRTVLEDVTQRDFASFFDQWYYGEGYPILDISWKQHNDSLIITVFQETSAPQVTPFFDLLIDLHISCMGGDTLVQIRPPSNNSETVVNLNKKVYKVNPDPDIWLIAEFRSVTRDLEGDSVRSFGVFPNPTQNELHIENYSIGLPFTARLYNSEGIFIDELSGTGAFETFFLNALPSGFYEVVVTRDHVREVFRITKL